MDLSHIAEFSAVARCGGIRKAAEELGVSPAALNARMHSLERSLGIELFCREGRNISLTEAGERLAASSAGMLGDLDALKQSLLSAARHNYRRLRIAVSGLGLPLYLGPFLDRLNLTYPDVDLELLDDSRYSIDEGVRSGEVDVYFAPVTEEFQAGRLEKVSHDTSNQFVLLPRQHPLAGRNSISIWELNGSVFIPYPRTAESCIRDFQIRNLEGSGIGYTLYDGYVSPRFYTLLVPIGKGLILLPAPLMNLPPNTVCVPVSDLPCPAVSSFFYDKSSSNPEVLSFVRDFNDFIKEVGGHKHRVSV